MARVTPCISYFQTTQNLGRVPETLNPQGQLSEKKIGGSDALYFMFWAYADFRQRGLWVWGFRGRPGGMRGALEYELLHSVVQPTPLSTQAHEVRPTPDKPQSLPQHDRKTNGTRPEDAPWRRARNTNEPQRKGAPTRYPHTARNKAKAGRSKDFVEKCASRTSGCTPIN